MGCNVLVPMIVYSKELLNNAEDPTQLSRRLHELSPTKRSGCIVALILRATTSSSKKRFLLSLSEPVVLEIMEETREVRYPFIGPIPRWLRVDRVSDVLCTVT